MNVLLFAVLVLGGLGLALGAALLWAAARLRGRDDEAVDAVHALLPQTQCAQCGFPGCRPYAEAVVRGEAGIDQCPPGGEATVRRLAELLGRDPVPVNPAYGTTAPPQVAVIDEALCIGCARCLQACPVDAIVGTHQMMHTVIREQCTGCELCLPPCPVDCIDLVPVDRGRPGSATTRLQAPEARRA